MVHTSKNQPVELDFVYERLLDGRIRKDFIIQSNNTLLRIKNTNTQNIIALPYLKQVIDVNDKKKGY